MKFKSKLEIIGVGLFIFLVSQGTYAFTSKDCIDSSFNTRIAHNTGPFGILETSLEIAKDKCILKIVHKKFYSRTYEIDVCRAPIHIKKGDKGVDIIKRVDCTDPKLSLDFCGHLRDLEEMLQDDGLIFALGEKEVLNSDHGKVFCSYELVSKYLREGVIFSRYASADESSLQGSEKLDLETPGIDEVRP